MAIFVLPSCTYPFEADQTDPTPIRPFSHQFEHVLHDYGRKLEADQDPKSKQKAKILTKWTHEEQSIKMLGVNLYLRPLQEFAS